MVLLLEKNQVIVNNMEDTAKIFMKGFKKWAKIHRINQTELGKVIKRDQTTISSYYQGTTTPSFGSVNLWLDHYNLDYDEILETGRKELEPSGLMPPMPELQQQIDELKQSVNNLTPTTDLEQHILTKHQKLVKTFPKDHQNTAFEINHKLVQISNIDPLYLQDLNDILTSKLNRLKKETTSNDALKEDQSSKRGKTA